MWVRVFYETTQLGSRPVASKTTVESVRPHVAGQHRAGAAVRTLLFYPISALRTMHAIPLPVPTRAFAADRAGVGQAAFAQWTLTGHRPARL